VAMNNGFLTDVTLKINSSHRFPCEPGGLPR
jgi:hypothetical protein